MTEHYASIVTRGSIRPVPLRWRTRATSGVPYFVAQYAAGTPPINESEVVVGARLGVDGFLGSGEDLGTLAAMFSRSCFGLSA